MLKSEEGSFKGYQRQSVSYLNEAKFIRSLLITTFGVRSVHVFLRLNWKDSFLEWEK